MKGGGPIWGGSHLKGGVSFEGGGSHLGGGGPIRREGSHLGGDPILGGVSPLVISGRIVAPRVPDVDVGSAAARAAQSSPCIN